MKKIFLIFCLTMCLFNTALAEEAKETAEAKAPAAAEEQQTEKQSDIKVLLDSRKRRKKPTLKCCLTPKT